MVPTTDEEKKNRKPVSKEELEKRELQWKKKQSFIAMGNSEEDAEIMSKLSDSELKQFNIDRQKRRAEDFFGVTRQSNIMKSNTLGEALTQMDIFGLNLNPQNWQSGSVIPTIKANTIEEAFEKLNKSGEVSYGDMFLMENKDGFKTRHYYERKGEPVDKETQEILKRLKNSLTPEEYETFINRYASFQQPLLRIDESGEYGTQYVWGLGKEGQGGKGTIYIDVKDQKSIDNLIESIYSEFAHSKQMKRRGLASYATKSIWDKAVDLGIKGSESIKNVSLGGDADLSIEGGPRYKRKNALEFLAHGSTTGEEMGKGDGYAGLEGGMLFEDFGHRGSYNHETERFENSITPLENPILLSDLTLSNQTSLIK